MMPIQASFGCTGSRREPRLFPGREKHGPDRAGKIERDVWTDSLGRYPCPTRVVSPGKCSTPPGVGERSHGSSETASAATERRRRPRSSPPPPSFSGSDRRDGPPPPSGAPPPCSTHQRPRRPLSSPSSFPRSTLLLEVHVPSGDSNGDGSTVNFHPTSTKRLARCCFGVSRGAHVCCLSYSALNI